MARLTLRDILLVSAERYGERPYIRYRKGEQWASISYAEHFDRLSRVSELLWGIGVRPGMRVAIMLENEPHWPEVYFGIVAMGATAVPIDAKLQAREAGHILRDSRVAVVVIRPSQRVLLEELCEAGVPVPPVVVLVDELLPDEELVPGVRVHYYDISHVDPASGAVLDDTFPRPDDVASIIYTSGTTGRAKGAMLTHRNFASQVYALGRHVAIREDDNFMVVLPLHHVLAFTGNLLMALGAGASISFARSLRTLSEDMREVRPSVLIGVPLLFDKMRDRVMSRINERLLSRWLYRMRLRGGIFRRVHAGLGGRLRMLISGGAPADPGTLSWFEQVGVGVLEGYGLTETAPVLSLSPPGGVRHGTVGKAVPGVSLRIAGDNREGIGEIQARGPNIFRGYFGNDEATAEAFEDGWFRTGDLGHIDSDGYVTISGRSKNMIVNREGKNIYPEEVEQCITENPYISEALVLGFSSEDQTGERVGCIVVPDATALDAYLSEQSQAFTDDQVIAFVADQVKQAGGSLAAYKRPRQIVVRFEPFEKTSTLKIKRYLYDM